MIEHVKLRVFGESMLGIATGDPSYMPFPL